MKSKNTKRKVKGGILAIIGYALSPLSWWNDLFINFPLAYLFGALFGLISKSLFAPMLIVGYWITNILGFILMHYGVKDVFTKGGSSKYSRKDFIKDLIISIIYTAIVALFVKLGWLKFPTEYF